MAGSVRVLLGSTIGVLLLVVAGCSNLSDQSPGGSGQPGADGGASQAGSGVDPASIDECTVGVEAIKSALGADATSDPMESVGCMWEGDSDGGELRYLSVDIDTTDLLDSSIVSDYDTLDGLGDQAFIGDHDEVISIRWQHGDIGVLLQEQAGTWEQDELVTIAEAIDADLP